MLGPKFGSEVKAAGLAGLAFSWSPDGTITGRENLTQQQSDALDVVIAAHNPAAVPAKILRLQEIEADADTIEIVTLLKTASLQEIKDYFTNGVVSVADARAAIIKLAIALTFLIKNGG